ncbi:MAG: hypothetical protein V1918_07075 [Planctomycetota bacterium]
MKIHVRLALGLFLFVSFEACRAYSAENALSSEAEAAVEHPRAPLIATGPDAPRMTVKLDAIPILKTVLPPRETYAIDPDVEVDIYFYRFVVRCPHGTYEVASVRNLVKLCHEIEVLERFGRTEQGSPFWEGVGQAGKGVGAGAKNLVVHPGESAKRVGYGFARFGRALGGPFRKKKPVLASDGTDRALAGKGPAGGERRLFAHELGLDVYTDNPNVQELMNRVSRRRLAGKLPLNTTVFALPGGSVFTLSLTPMGTDPTTEEIIRDKGPEELRRELAIRYQKEFGLVYGPEEAAITRLLDNPNYTPREEAYLHLYLADMKTLKNIQGAVEFLARVDTPEKAGVVSAQAELLSLLHQRARPLDAFVPVRNTLGAKSRDGTLCLVISIDTVRYWSDVMTSLRLGVEAARGHGAGAVEFWSTGDVDERSLAAARAMGVVVHPNVLENPVFMKPREAGQP